MNPGDVPTEAVAAAESPQNLLEAIGFRLHVSFPELLAIDPEERAEA